jgi:hypothetical protein
MACTVAASLGVKKYQPSGLTGFGGSPAKADQGTSPDKYFASADAAKTGIAATDASRRRRLILRISRISSPTDFDSVFLGFDPTHSFLMAQIRRFDFEGAKMRQVEKLGGQETFGTKAFLRNGGAWSGFKQRWGNTLLGG